MMLAIRKTSSEATLDLDTSADVDNNLGITIAAGDVITNASEASDVSTTLSGVDADATAVKVTFTDSNNNTVTVDATNDGSGWTVPDADLSTLVDGDIKVTATVTDDAGNTKTSSEATLDLDTSADVDNNLGIAVAAGDETTNALEVGHVSTTLTGVDADADSVKVSFTDGTTTVTVDATNDGSGWTVPDADLSTLADGDIKVTAIVTDDAGNTKTSSEATLDLDTTIATPVISFEATGDDNIYNIEEVAAGAKDTVTATISVTGSEVGDTLTYSVNGVEASPVTLTQKGY